MKHKIIGRFRQEVWKFQEVSKTLSPTEKIVAGTVFGVWLILPLPGTWPGAIVLITLYTKKRIQKTIDKDTWIE